MPEQPIYPNFQDQSIVDIPVAPNATATPFDMYKAIIGKANGTLNSNSYLNVPVLKTPLEPTLRYDDPYYGFSATNPDIEAQYADRQPWYQAFGNNIAKFSANTLGAVAESIIAIPSAIYSIASEGDFSKTYNNDIINGITDWQEGLETTLPTYQTQYEKDNPILSAFNPFQLKAFGNTWGSVLKNLGYTAGTIIGSIAIDVGIGALTGGVGEIPLLATQGERIVQAASRLGKIFSGGSKAVEGYTQALNSGESVITAINRLSNINKLQSNFRYGFGLFNSALGEATVEANQTYKQTQDQLTQDYINRYGVNPVGDEIDKINSYAENASTANLIANTALLTVTNSITLGSFFKPTGQAIKEGVEHEVAKGVKAKLINLDTWEKINPAKGFKGIIGSSGRLAKTVGAEGFEEGFQFFSDSSIRDFTQRKYNDENVELTDNLWKSLGTGLSQTFLTSEGQQNILLGALSGGLIHAVRGISERRKGAITSKNQLADSMINLLNSQGVTGLFEHNYDGTVNATSITNDMAQAAKEGNVFKYRNLKHQQLFNFVNTGVKTNRFNARIDQLNELKGLTQQQFETMFQLEDNSANRRTVNEYVDTLIGQANTIRKDVDKVNNAFVNPYNYKTQGADWKSFDDYKSALALSLSTIKDNRNRIESLGSEIQTTLPTSDINKIVNLTNQEGIQDTIKQFQERLDFINEATDESSPKDIQERNNQEKKFLNEQISFLKSNAKTSNPEEYIRGVQDLLNYYANANTIDGKFKTDITDTVSVLNRSQDIYKLGKMADNATDYYNKLTTKEGYDEFALEVKTLLDSEASRIQIGENGDFRYRTRQELEADEAAANQIDEANIEEVVNEQNTPEETTPEERQKIKDIIQKENNGEELTDEEEALIEEKPQAYKNRKKVESKRTPKEEGLPPFDPEAEDALIETEKQKAESKPASTNDKNFVGFSPVNTLFKSLTKDYKDEKQETNLYNAIFKKEDFNGSLTVKVEAATKGNNSNKFTRIPGTNFYRRGYSEDIRVYSNGDIVGQLQDNLYFKRGNDYLPITELTAEEYADTTNNEGETYSKFMDEVNSYQNLINTIKAKGKLTNNEFNELVDKIVVGYDAVYSATQAEATPLKDIEINKKGMVVLSFPVIRQEDGSYSRTDKPFVIGENGLEENNQEVIDYVGNNLQKLKGFNRRYIVLFKNPAGGFDNKSAFAARPIAAESQSLNDIFIAAQSGDQKFNELIGQTYIADSRNANSGVSMKLNMNDDGTITFTLNNRAAGKQKRKSFSTTLSQEQIQSVDDFEGLTDLLSEQLVDATRSRENSWFKGTTLRPEDFKQDIIQDEFTNLNTFNSSLTVATTPYVYQNTRFYAYPKTNRVVPTIPKPKVATESIPTYTQGQEVAVTIKSGQKVVFTYNNNKWQFKDSKGNWQNASKVDINKIEEVLKPIVVQGKTSSELQDELDLNRQLLEKATDEKQTEKLKEKIQQGEETIKILEDGRKQITIQNSAIKVTFGLPFTKEEQIVAEENSKEVTQEVKKVKEKQLKVTKVLNDLDRVFYQSYRKRLDESQMRKLKEQDPEIDPATGKLDPSYLKETLGITYSGAIALSDRVGQIIGASEYFKNKPSGITRTKTEEEEILEIPQDLFNFVNRNFKKIKNQLQRLGESGAVQINC